MPRSHNDTGVNPSTFQLEGKGLFRVDPEGRLSLIQRWGLVLPNGSNHFKESLRVQVEKLLLILLAHR